VGKKIKNIHFMGIGGSGISAVAALAKEYGYSVSGCDLDKSSIDLLPLKTAAIKKDHNVTHLKNVDLLVVSPAVLLQSEGNEELKIAQKKGIVITWQEFLGQYLMKDKKILAVSGTHGKSTTTAMLALVLEKAGLDPTVVVGANIPNWNANYRFGKGDYFVIEADEYFGNFLHYNPEYVIINNIEFDHPDYFSNLDDIKKNFVRFLDNLTGEKTVIANYGDVEVKRLFSDKTLLKNLKVISHKLGRSTSSDARVALSDSDENKTNFRIKSKKLRIDSNYALSIPGVFNVANAAGVVLLAHLLDIGDKIIKQALEEYSGIGRRMEVLGEKKGVKVIDDYAHHPTAIKLTLDALKKKYPEDSIWCVVEPHSYSRTEALLEQYKDAFTSADRVILGPIFRARDSSTFGVSSESIVRKSSHENTIALDSIDKIVKLIKKDVKSPATVVVMGAGKSSKWAKEILKSL
jgi:UDP-N-acetylmuramate--alanine ligase